MHTTNRTRRTLIVFVAAVGAAAITVAGLSYAQSATTGPSKDISPAASTGILPGIHQTLSQLVLQGSITQIQADAVEHQAYTGSINPKELVQSGVVTDAQMHIVADAIDAVKAAG